MRDWTALDSLVWAALAVAAFVALICAPALLSLSFIDPSTSPVP